MNIPLLGIILKQTTSSNPCIMISIRNRLLFFAGLGGGYIPDTIYIYMETRIGVAYYYIACRFSNFTTSCHVREEVYAIHGILVDVPHPKLL